MEIIKNEQTVECTYESIEEKERHIIEMKENNWKIEREDKFYLEHNPNPFDDEFVRDYLPFVKYTRTALIG